MVTQPQTPAKARNVTLASHNITDTSEQRTFAAASTASAAAQVEHLRLDLVTDLTSAVLTVWDRASPIALAHKGLPEDYCENVAVAFEASTARTARRDGVPGFEIGATQYGKSGADYTRQAARVNPELHRILGGYDGIILQQLRALALAFAARGIQFRPLVYRGEIAAIMRFAQWRADVESARWLLRPHDDMAQVRGYADWEISNLEMVIAVNIYLRSVPGSGQLIVSGWKPTENDRRARGVEKSGYPYAEGEVLHRPHVIIPVAPGDIAVIDGGYAHGVLVGDGATNDRLLANLFIGKVGDTAVYWA